ncbi:hypothetical protein BFW38_05895 [Terasakiispira papahanaumokuakeensis]|uniref:Phosphatase NudJ n=1 Tax=Terasakiispira papahanaumokuakeensis TaxID=197479 RepID=A0A1E2V832_9GAMM|nr:NUDIX hydrolase [Terasakiispira papahanaumokuakeensis]ODC03147.1 hypothetical protein BFW38_05895 [Terasakiispira papahanaumokuakeensis]
MTRWMPHATVATVIHDDGYFLLTEEMSEGRQVLNQPAGHIEFGESLIAAAYRETLEETGWEVNITHYQGLYINTSPSGITYHRHCFIGTPIKAQPDATLDEGIIGPRWLTWNDLLNAEQQQQLRSPMVIPCYRDFRDGKQFPLDIIWNFDQGDR